jgi:predicted AAA+ superfamily ATPase
VKDISDQEVTEHLKRLNTWWSAKQVDDQVRNWKPRAYLDAVRRLVADDKLRRAVVLMGPRRVGKTVLILHLIDDLLKSVPSTSIGYVEMDHPILRGRALESLIALLDQASGGKLKYVFFDEIQYLKDWEQHLKQLVDHAPHLRILVSGSAAAALKRKSVESGAGRFTDFLLPPLTFQEYLNLATKEPAMVETEPEKYRVLNWEILNEQFVDYINFGGYPELALSPTVRSDPARFVKSDIVDKVLLRDLPQLYGIQDIQELNQLFALLAYNSGHEVSPQNLSQKCGVGKPTIQRYIEYLEAAFLLKRIYRVDQSGKRYQRERSFKVYLTNPAMRTGLFGPSKPDEDGFGELVETALFAQRFHEDANIFYAHWGSDDCEVDMIDCGSTLKPKMALEVKWSDSVEHALSPASALIKFCKSTKLGDAWIGAKTRFEANDSTSPKTRVWPCAALAYMFGARAVRRSLESFNASLSLYQLELPLTDPL